MTVPSPGTWALHPDRALPADPVTRDLARAVYAQTRDLPIVSMHGHVDAAMLRRNEHFGDPAEVFVVPDHYLVRMIVSQGVPHDALGVPRKDGGAVETDPRAIWRTFCANWKLYRGTPTRYWLEHVFVEVFGLSARPSAETADTLYDEIVAKLATDEYRPLALFDRFDMEIVATTDPATATLSDHAALAERGWGQRVVPTFRPDAVLQLDKPGWRDDVALLAERADIAVDSYPSYLRALEARRAAFVAAGARATDHGHLSADTTPLPADEAARIFAAALRGEVTTAEADAFSGNMLWEMARMSTQDGLTMQIHPGVLRNHSADVFAARGADVGYDIPVPTEYTHSLRPLLESFGHHPDLRLIVFTVDETVFARELAPLAGVYPAMKLGAPWWFLDTPDGMRRYREAVTDTAGFYNTTGFVDDTRAFFSIPARHDLARRIDAGHLGRLVAEHRLDLDEAVETAVDLAYNLPKAAYPALG
ncbi:glucuronate isomerase [Cellulomonas sp. ATA003]|uniref:glucuronate isomerase n=1 Tax=Cellulomonas sp. ATA003 TaxID=3073064 RepID=UPI002873AF6C|nr:glucuronate isomerase [Cellulomonas sp. ATA003]WNB85906.1 glucuronate isomerase [Cellulomonas sp. ATA003]